MAERSFLNCRELRGWRWKGCVGKRLVRGHLYLMTLWIHSEERMTSWAGVARASGGVAMGENGGLVCVCVCVCVCVYMCVCVCVCVCVYTCCCWIAQFNLCHFCGKDQYQNPRRWKARKIISSRTLPSPFMLRCPFFRCCIDCGQQSHHTVSIYIQTTIVKDWCMEAEIWNPQPADHLAYKPITWLAWPGQTGYACGFVPIHGWITRKHACLPTVCTCQTNSFLTCLQDSQFSIFQGVTFNPSLIFFFFLGGWYCHHLITNLEGLYHSVLRAANP